MFLENSQAILMDTRVREEVLGKDYYFAHLNAWCKLTDLLINWTINKSLEIMSKIAISFAVI